MVKRKPPIDCSIDEWTKPSIWEDIVASQHVEFYFVDYNGDKQNVIPESKKVSTSYRMGSSAIWHIFFEFQIFRHIFRAFRRGKYRKDLERKKYMPYCTRITCDNLFIVNTKDKISYQSVHIKFICKHFI